MRHPLYRNPSNHSIGAISIRETYLIPVAETFVVGESVLFGLDLLNLILLISIKLDQTNLECDMV